MAAIDPALSSARPTPKTHPKVRWWTMGQFENWLKTPEAMATVCTTEPYLENENGDSISMKELTEIRTTVRSAWAKLVNRKLAPRVWGQLAASGKQLFHSIIESKHPILTYDNDHWKVEHLAQWSYSAWRRQHLDDEGNWKKKPGSIKAEMDDTDVSLNASETSQKQKGKAKTTDSDESGIKVKKPKGVFDIFYSTFQYQLIFITVTSDDDCYRPTLIFPDFSLFFLIF
jgi:hypothetical protein